MLDSHRREVTVVFCDLRGFTSFSETAEPEEIMSTLREYHAAVGAIIHKFEGTIEHFAGDGLMAMLNDPVPCADPCGQAVRMAAEMRAAVGGLSAKWRKHGFELGFGVGIAHGYATLGRIGFEGRFDYAAIGSVTNLAARLCAEAKDGQILIDSKVGVAVEEIAELEPLDALTLKGFHRPVRASNVRAISASFRGDLDAFENAFVVRDISVEHGTHRPDQRSRMLRHFDLAAGAFDDAVICQLVDLTKCRSKLTGVGIMRRT